MKDRIFEGTDKEAALQRAAETLGVAPAELRHVVLEERAGHAQIAVLGVSETSRATPSHDAAGQPDEPDDDEYEYEDPKEGIQEILAGLTRAADLDVSVEMIEDEKRLMAKLSGADAGFFTADEGRVLNAVEYLLQRTYGDDVQPQKILVDAGAYREEREAGLRRRAAELAQAVSDDGETRTTEPLNSYERRIVHMVIAELAGLNSRSEGEGSRRRVHIETAGVSEG